MSICVLSLGLGGFLVRFAQLVWNLLDEVLLDKLHPAVPFALVTLLEGVGQSSVAAIADFQLAVGLSSPKAIPHNLMAAMSSVAAARAVGLVVSKEVGLPARRRSHCHRPKCGWSFLSHDRSLCLQNGSGACPSSCKDNAFFGLRLEETGRQSCGGANAHGGRQVRTTVIHGVVVACSLRSIQCLTARLRLPGRSPCTGRVRGLGRP